MTRRLHIVSVCRSLPTPSHASAGVFVLNRLAAMARFAHVRVIQPVPFFPGLRPLPEWAMAPSRTIGDLEIVHAPMFYLPGMLKSLDAAWLARAIAEPVARLADEAPIDLLDAHFGFPDGAGCFRVTRRIGLPLFITLRGFEQERVHDALIGREMAAAMRGATGCVAVSGTLRDLALRCGVPDTRVRVVHNAIDGAVFAPGDRNAARVRLGLGAQAPLVVSVGHRIERKRHHVLVAAFARVVARRPDARLAIIGGRTDEPAYDDRLQALVARLGLAERVHMVGNLPQPSVVDWLRAADAFALLSAREGCCNAVLEALAVGVPTMATDAGDNAAFVDPSNGVIVPIDDVDATAAGLDRLLSRGAGDRTAIASRLRSRVGDWDTVAHRVLEFFAERLRSARLPEVPRVP